MRLKAEAVLEFGSDDDRQPTKIVRDYRRRYKAIDEILGRHPEILGMVHGDLAKLSQATSRRGRKADFTSENLFRAILVMQREGFDYREASIRIAESETLQNVTVHFPEESWELAFSCLVISRIYMGHEPSRLRE